MIPSMDSNIFEEFNGIWVQNSGDDVAAVVQDGVVFWSNGNTSNLIRIDVNSIEIWLKGRTYVATLVAPMHIKWNNGDEWNLLDGDAIDSEERTVSVKSSATAARLRKLNNQHSGDQREGAQNTPLHKIAASTTENKGRSPAVCENAIKEQLSELTSSQGLRYGSLMSLCGQDYIRKNSKASTLSSNSHSSAHVMIKKSIDRKSSVTSPRGGSILKTSLMSVAEKDEEQDDPCDGEAESRSTTESKYKLRAPPSLNFIGGNKEEQSPKVSSIITSPNDEQPSQNVPDTQQSCQATGLLTTQASNMSSMGNTPYGSTNMYAMMGQNISAGNTPNASDMMPNGVYGELAVNSQVSMGEPEEVDGPQIQIKNNGILNLDKITLTERSLQPLNNGPSQGFLSMPMKKCNLERSITWAASPMVGASQEDSGPNGEEPVIRHSEGQPNRLKKKRATGSNRTTLVEGGGHFSPPRPRIIEATPDGYVHRYLIDEPGKRGGRQEDSFERELEVMFNPSTGIVTKGMSPIPQITSPKISGILSQKSSENLSMQQMPILANSSINEVASEAVTAQEMSKISPRMGDFTSAVRQEPRDSNPPPSSNMQAYINTRSNLEKLNAEGEKLKKSVAPKSTTRPLAVHDIDLENKPVSDDIKNAVRKYTKSLSQNGSKNGSTPVSKKNGTPTPILPNKSATEPLPDPLKLPRSVYKDNIQSNVGSPFSEAAFSRKLSESVSSLGTSRTSTGRYKDLNDVLEDVPVMEKMIANLQNAFNSFNSNSVKTLKKSEKILEETCPEKQKKERTENKEKVDKKKKKTITDVKGDVEALSKMLTLMDKEMKVQEKELENKRTFSPNKSKTAHIGVLDHFERMALQATPTLPLMKERKLTVDRNGEGTNTSKGSLEKARALLENFVDQSPSVTKKLELMKEGEKLFQKSEINAQRRIQSEIPAVEKTKTVLHKTVQSLDAFVTEKLNYDSIPHEREQVNDQNLAPQATLPSSPCHLTQPKNILPDSEKASSTDRVLEQKLKNGSRTLEFFDEQKDQPQVHGTNMEQSANDTTAPPTDITLPHTSGEDDAYDFSVVQEEEEAVIPKKPVDREQLTSTSPRRRGKERKKKFPTNIENDASPISISDLIEKENANSGLAPAFSYVTLPDGELTVAPLEQEGISTDVKESHSFKMQQDDSVVSHKHAMNVEAEEMKSASSEFKRTNPVGEMEVPIVSHVQENDAFMEVEEHNLHVTTAEPHHKELPSSQLSQSNEIQSPIQNTEMVCVVETDSKELPTAIFKDEKEYDSDESPRSTRAPDSPRTFGSSGQTEIPKSNLTNEQDNSVGTPQGNPTVPVSQENATRRSNNKEHSQGEVPIRRQRSTPISTIVEVNTRKSKDRAGSTSRQKTASKVSTLSNFTRSTINSKQSPIDSRNGSGSMNFTKSNSFFSTPAPPPLGPQYITSTPTSLDQKRKTSLSLMKSLSKDFKVERDSKISNPIPKRSSIPPRQSRSTSNSLSRKGSISPKDTNPRNSERWRS